MKRRNFLIKTGLGAAAIVTAPTIISGIIPEETVVSAGKIIPIETQVSIVNHITGQRIFIPTNGKSMSILELHRAIQKSADMAYEKDGVEFSWKLENNPSIRHADDHISLINNYDIHEDSVAKLHGGTLEIEHSGDMYISVESWENLLNCLS